MKYRLAIFALLLCSAFCVSKAQNNETTIMGDVVDIVSYMTSGTMPDSPAGVEIIHESAKGGNPLGILEQTTGRIYVVTLKQSSTGANQTLLPWVGTKITAKGKVYSKGSARVLVLTTIGKGSGQ